MKIHSQIISKAKYEEITHEIKELSLAYSISWHSLIKKSMNLEILYIASFNKKKEIVAVMPLIIKKFFFLKLIGSPLRGTHTQRMGPLILHKNQSIDLYEKIIYSIEKLLKFNYFEIVLTKESKKNKDFKLNGFNQKKFKTNLIYLISEDQNWSQLHSRARNMVRKAKKNNVKVSLVKINNEWIEVFYNLLEITFLRQNKYVPHKKEFYKNLINIENNLICLEAKLEDEFISGGIFTLDGEKITFLSGVSSSIGMKLAASSLIQWEIIKYGIEKNFKIYDMGGLGVKSIDKFKLSFGGEVDYFQKHIKKDFLFTFCEKMFNGIFLKINFYKLKITKLFNL